MLLCIFSTSKRRRKRSDQNHGQPSCFYFHEPYFYELCEKSAIVDSDKK